MSNSAAISAALAWPFLLLGNLACDFIGMGKTEYRELVRMLRVDRISEEAIGRLVDCFYAKIRVDPDLGPIFERVVRDKWGPHLETMRNFWSSVMLTSGRYKGAPVPAHLRIKDIQPPMFDIWLRLFGDTCDKLFENEVAEAFRIKAARVAESLKLAMFFRPDLIAPRKSS